MKKKRCCGCGKPKILSDFFKHRSRPDGRQAECKRCQMNRNTAKRKNNPIFAAKARDYRLRRRYGITASQFDELMILQDGRCVVCRVKWDEVKRPGVRQNGKKGEGFVVDHNYKTGVIRGLLCDRCNRAIGLMEESGLLLQSAANHVNSGGLSYTPSMAAPQARPPRPFVPADEDELRDPVAV